MSDQIPAQRLAEKRCAYCGKSFRTYPSWEKAGRRTCSRACRTRLPRFNPPTAVDTEFWKRVDKGAEDWHCWWWTGNTDGKGYGRLGVKRKGELAHRVSYRLHNCYPIEPEVVMHICDNPSCVNPLHLRGGTQIENRMDCVRKGRHAHKPKLEEL